MSTNKSANTFSQIEELIGDIFTAFVKPAAIVFEYKKPSGETYFSIIQQQINPTTAQAIKFMTATAIISVIIDSIPSFFSHIQALSTLFLIPYVVIIIFIWIFYSFIMYFCMKILGGKESFINSLKAFCYASAFFPLAVLFSIKFKQNMIVALLEKEVVGLDDLFSLIMHPSFYSGMVVNISWIGCVFFLSIMIYKYCRSM